MTEQNNYYVLRGLLLMAAGMLFDACASIILELASGKALVYTGYGISVISSVLYIIGIVIIKTQFEYFRRAKICIIWMLALSVAVFLMTAAAYYFSFIALGSAAAVLAIALVVVSLLMVYYLLRGCADIGEDQGDENHEIFCNRSWVIYLAAFGVSYVVGGIASNILGSTSGAGAAISSAMTYLGMAAKLLVGYVCWKTYKKFNDKKINAY
ncbi:MAG: hypothetical protein LKJ83_01855 [Eubacteriaceae bacterium]|jgi:hypothetical protein|nr:hypothetical protein [Eubacteriaceae bacterium]